MQSPSLPTSSSPLEQLADIHLPDRVSWWPLAPGWWILLALICMTAAGVWLWRRHKAQNFYRTIAQHQLAGIYADLQQTQNAAAYLQALSLLLRRTALTAHPHSFNAAIKGKDWLQWLDDTCPALSKKFSGDIGQPLLRSAYEKNPQLDISELHQLSSEWIKLHRNHRQKITAPKKSKTITAEIKETSHV